MYSSNKAEQASNYTAIQSLVAVFSFIFFFVIAYGYSNLFSGFGAFLAFVGGVTMAAFAWLLARVMGTASKGPARAWGWFIPLFIVSGAGVYNSLMLYLEGGEIVSDSITASQEQLERLQVAAEQGLSAQGAARRINNIRSLKESLFSEIRNPANCGQGPEARRLISELRAQLPGFTALSTPNKDCSKNEEIVADYERRIEDLILKDPRNAPGLVMVQRGAEDTRNALEQLRVEATTNYAPGSLQRTSKALESHDATYRALRFRAAGVENVKDLPQSLPIEPVQSLGNAGKLPTLIISRLGEPATWAYLLIAAGFDLLMVNLFAYAKRHRTRPAAAQSGLGGIL